MDSPGPPGKLRTPTRPPPESRADGCASYRWLCGGRPPVSKRIQTCDEFEAALERVRFARERLPDLQWLVTTREMPLRSYGLWGVLLHLVHDAIALHDWSSVGELLKLYDCVQSAGKRGEMWEASYVAFLEDV